MRRRVLVALAVLGVVAASVVAYVAWPRGATPVTEQEALDDFRARSGGDLSQEDVTGAARPSPGVYTYASSGQEIVKLGVLPAETRPYPDRMTLVVVHDDASCFTSTLNLIDQHTEATTYCLDGDGGLRIDAHTKHQQVGALRPIASMSCDPATLVTGTAEARDLVCTLELSGGPAQLSASLGGTVQIGEPATVAVGDEEVEAVAVEVHYDISGDLDGTWRERLWLATADWLPVRIERDLDLRGLATLTEQSSLELVDIVPAR